jgi:hypothetical protein
MHPSFTAELRKLWLALVLFCCAWWSARGQSTRRVVEEPRWLKYDIREVSAGVLVEGSYEETSFAGSDTKVSHNRIFVGPLFGLTAGGSIYHPNFMRYDISAEGAYGHTWETIDRGGSSISREQWQYLGRFDATASLLAHKPYNAQIFGGYDHSYRDYDFFNRVIVDTWRYGARAAWSIENLFLNASYTHRDEDVSGLNIDTQSRDDTIAFSARHDRQTAGSSFNYTYNEYSRVDFSRIGEGSDHTVALSDYERFGARKQFTLNSTASYNHRDDNVEVSDQFTAGLNLTAEHKHNLSSLYDLTYDHFETGSFTSDGFSGNGELRHQLYESLNSALVVRGATSDASDERSSGYTRRYGGGFSETYTKRLSEKSRMRISNSLLIDHVDQQSISTVENERHSFDEGSGPAGTFFLNGTRIDTLTIVITDRNDSQPPFARAIDYNVEVNGDRVLISRAAGSRIGASDTVLVDYRAEPSTAGRYESLAETFQVRFDLWKDLWGIYGRFNLWRNNADRDLRVANLTSYAVGTDVSWHWLRAGMEYEIYDSDLSEYRAARFFESAAFNLDASSTLSLDFSQAWIDYVDANRQEQSYRFITRYSQMFTPRLRFTIEGGIDLRRGETVEQTLATVRPGIEYAIGKTTVRAGYDFEYNMFDREERMRHLFFLRVRRVF